MASSFNVVNYCAKFPINSSNGCPVFTFSSSKFTNLGLHEGQKICSCYYFLSLHLLYCKEKVAVVSKISKSHGSLSPLSSLGGGTNPTPSNTQILSIMTLDLKFCQCAKFLVRHVCAKFQGRMAFQS